MFAQFEVRCKNIDAARSIFGNAIGRAPKAKIFDAYITLEMQLGNMERCRAIYEKCERAPGISILCCRDSAPNSSLLCM